MKTKSTCPVDPRVLVIRASAGTGKTFQLSNRYLALLRQVPPERILATTFTRKAAGEILERILLRLARAALDAAETKTLAAFLGPSPLSQDECSSLLAEFTRQLHLVRISTIDAFFARLATVYSLELGLSPAWRILDGVEVARLRDEAIQAVLRDGETRDLVQLVHMLDQGEARRRVHAMISDRIEASYDLFAMTDARAWERFPPVRFLSATHRNELLEQLEALPLDGKALVKARDDDCERFRQGDWASLLEKGLSKAVLNNSTTYSRKSIPAEAVRLYRRLHVHVMAELVQPWADQTRAVRQLLERYDTAYEACKRAAQGLYFNDVTRLLSRSLAELGPLNVEYRLDGGIEHLLLDEFQDTSIAQWEVVRSFAQKVCRHAAGSFFCVGDVKQAIYGWRGGQAELFDALDVELPGIQAEALDKSFRSSPVIMETVNKVFAGVAAHDGTDDLSEVLQRWSHSFPPHHAARDLPGYAVLRVAPLPDDFADNWRQTSALDAATVQYVARYVGDLVQQTPHKSIGVLVRKNDVVRRLVYELGQLGVEASEEGGNPLLDSAAVNLVLSLMHFVDHPGDTVSRYHVATSPLGPIVGYTDHTAHSSTHRFAIGFRRKLLQEGYSKIVHWLVRELAPLCSRRELRRLQQLATVADGYDGSATLRPSDFVCYVEDQRVQEATAAGVRVMTVHQSKGLEFDTVVLPNLDERLMAPPGFVTYSSSATSPPQLVALYRNQSLLKLLPDELKLAFKQTAERGLHESLCLLYVALTRAVHSLHMIVRPQRRNKDGQLPKTYAGLLQAALAPGRDVTPESVLFETGDPQWFTALEPAEGVRSEGVPLAPCQEGGGRPDAEPIAVDTSQAGPPASPAPLPREKGDETPLKIRLAPPAATRRRHLKRVSPSQKSEVRYAHIGGAVSIDNSVALSRGTLFHRWLEEIHWLDDGIPSNDDLCRLAAHVDSQPLHVDAAVAQFRKALTSGPVAAVLSRESYQAGSELSFPDGIQRLFAGGPCDLQVFLEHPFVIPEGDGLLSGTIDRLVLIGREGQVLGADIVDYKTDSGDTPADKKVEEYRGQLAGYVRAVSHIYRLSPERISARLVFLANGGRVETVTSLL